MFGCQPAVSGGDSGNKEAIEADADADANANVSMCLARRRSVVRISCAIGENKNAARHGRQARRALYPLSAALY